MAAGAAGAWEGCEACGGRADIMVSAPRGRRVAWQSRGTRWRQAHLWRFRASPPTAATAPQGWGASPVAPARRRPVMPRQVTRHHACAAAGTRRARGGPRRGAQSAARVAHCSTLATPAAGGRRRSRNAPDLQELDVEGVDKHSGATPAAGDVAVAVDRLASRPVDSHRSKIRPSATPTRLTIPASHPAASTLPRPLAPKLRTRQRPPWTRASCSRGRSARRHRRWCPLPTAPSGRRRSRTASAAWRG